MTIAVIADDLTSAADGAGPFVRRGLSGRIAFDGAPVGGDPDVVAVDTDSRELPRRAAAERTAAVVASWRHAHVLLKTVDSTLRGNLVDEVDAALEASGRTTAVIAPAFPRAGRTTRHGVQYLDDVPVKETSFGADRNHPVRSSDLNVLFPDAFPWVPGHAVPPGIVIADSRTDDELDAVARSVPDPSTVLWVGSPGLASSLARVHAGPIRPATRIAPVGRRTLVVVGSRNEVSHEQLAELVPAERVIALPDGDLAAATGRLTSLIVEHGLAGVVDRSVAATAVEVGHRLATAAAGAFEQGAVDTLFVTGGATARAVLTAMHVHSLDLVDEPEPGVIAATAAGARPLLVVVKAGGFGTAGTFRRLHDLYTNGTEELA